MMKHKKHDLTLSADWDILRHEFYNIDPFDDSPAGDKQSLIFEEENLLWIRNKDYNIDLGWYGGSKPASSAAGFWIYVYRGEHWHKCELLEKFRSTDKATILEKLNYFIESVESGAYKAVHGHKIDEDDPMNRNSMNDFDYYSAQA